MLTMLEDLLARVVIWLRPDIAGAVAEEGRDMERERKGGVAC